MGDKNTVPEFKYTVTGIPIRIPLMMPKRLTYLPLLIVAIVAWHTALFADAGDPLDMTEVKQNAAAINHEIDKYIARIKL